jgi:hypothetical protein
MTLKFEVNETKESPHGTYLIGQFLEKPPLLASDQKLKLGEFMFEIWGVPRKGIWTLKLVTEKEFNMALEEQTVLLEIL